MYRPGLGLLEIESGRHKELSGSKTSRVGPFSVQMRLKEPSVGKWEKVVKPQVRDTQDDLSYPSQRRESEVTVEFCKTTDKPLCRHEVLPAPALCCYKQEMSK